jgi:hypothetical protein
MNKTMVIYLTDIESLTIPMGAKTYADIHKIMLDEFGLSPYNDSHWDYKVTDNSKFTIFQLKHPNHIALISYED